MKTPARVWIGFALIGVCLAALPFALTLQRIANGLTRPFFGWVSDNKIGRAHV